MGLCCNSACKKCGTASLTLDQERERSVEELQLDEVMVFVAKLVTFLVVCGICSVTTVAVGLHPCDYNMWCVYGDKYIQ